MDTLSAADVARRLGTSVPRVTRAVRRLGIGAARGGRVRLTERQVDALEADLGTVQTVDGLTRVETRVLAALARAPRGLLSARAVARRAGVSPTAATRAVRSLQTRGLVRTEREWIASGRAREADVIRADVTTPEWPALAHGLAAVRFPAQRSLEKPTRVPARLRHLFWNADPSAIELDRHGAFVAERLLSTGDLDGLAWGLQVLSRADWKQAAGNRGLSPRQRALAHNLARSVRT